MVISWMKTPLDNDQCASSVALLTVHHSIIECQGLQPERRRMMATTKQRDWNMKNLLSDVGKIHVVLEFLRMTNIFGHI